MATKKQQDDLSFEEALDQLEAVIEAMEAGEVPLDALVEKYEEGGKLLKHCQERLARAELRIRKLNIDEDGLPASTEPVGDDPSA
ncbi:MAG: exodeoxyribonuclease VII small subunit [Opitutales bacterium]